MSRVFLDTNVVVYAFDASEPAKQEHARRALTGAEHEFVISTQVLLEFYVVVTRKLDPPLPQRAAARAVDVLSGLPVVSTDAALVQHAVETAGRHQIPVWDALILAAAAQAGCDEVWTEDLAAGSTIRDVRVVNPFEAWAAS